MKNIFIILFFILFYAKFGYGRIVVTNQTNEISNYKAKILGGAEGTRCLFPFLVSLRQNDTHICGGTIGYFSMTLVKFLINILFYKNAI